MEAFTNCWAREICSITLQLLLVDTTREHKKSALSNLEVILIKRIIVRIMSFEFRLIESIYLTYFIYITLGLDHIALLKRHLLKIKSKQIHHLQKILRLPRSVKKFKTIISLKLL